MSSQPKGYVDATYLDTAVKQLKLHNFKRLTYERMPHNQDKRYSMWVAVLARIRSRSREWWAHRVRSFGVNHDAEMIAEAEPTRSESGGHAWVTHRREADCDRAAV